MNPLAGCLPALAQIPIFILFYRALLRLAEDDLLNERFLSERLVGALATPYRRRRSIRGLVVSQALTLNPNPKCPEHQ